MVQQRLPYVDGDDGDWGDILNQYMSKEHYDTGLDNAANGGHQKVTIRAGTSNPGTAPLKFATGPLMTTPEVGAVEFLSDKLYFTKSTGPTRTTIATYDDTSGATGDIYYRTSTASGGLFTRIPVGSTNDLLTVASGIPAWSSTATVGLASGPASATDNAITRYDGTTGKLLQSSAASIDDSGNATFGIGIAGAVAAPALIDLGANYGSNTPGNVANLKLKLYSGYGIGISGGLLEIQSGSATGFYLNGTQIMRLASTGVTIYTAGTTAGSAVTIDGAQTLTNKTISGSNNTISNLSAAAITSGVLPRSVIGIQDFTNLAAGSSFDGAAHPWTLGTNWSVATDQFHSGAQSLKHVAAGAGSSTLQGNFEVQLGERLYIELWARRDSTYNGTDGTAKLRIANLADNSLIGAVTYGTTGVPVADTWTKRTGTITVPAGVTALSIALNDDGTAGNLWIDDVVIRRVQATYLDTDFTLQDDVTPTKQAQFQLSSITAGATRVMTIPDYNGMIATQAGVETLTSKTLTDPKINNIKDTNGNTVLGISATASAVNYVQVNNSAAGGSPVISAIGSDTNLSLYMKPKGTGSVVITDGTDSTKTLRFDLTANSTATNRILTIPNADLTVVGTNTTQTLTSKTLTTPKIDSVLDTTGNKVLSINGTGGNANYVEISGNASFGNVGISALGSDLSINLALNPKGAGVVLANGSQVVTDASTSILTNKTLTSPVINTSVSGSAVATAATASTLALRDASANLSANAYIPGFKTQVSSASPVPLAITDKQIQEFTGTTQAQTVLLPTTSIVAGAQYTIVNNLTTAAVTVQSSGANTVSTMAAGTTATFTAMVATPTTAAHWDSTYVTGGGSGTVTNTGGSLTANSIVLGAGTNDSKVVAGITTNGTSKINLGVAGTSVGSIDFRNATSGAITLAPVAGALGTVTLSLPAATDTLVGKATTDILTNKTLTSATVTTKIAPTTDDGAPLGDTTHNFSDLFLASGAVVNYANSNVVMTHSSGILTMGTGEFRITTPGTNSTSVPTLGSTSTLTNKTIDNTNTITALNAKIRAGANLVLNSDFEDTTYPLFGGGNYSTDHARSGTHSYKITANGSFIGLELNGSLAGRTSATAMKVQGAQVFYLEAWVYPASGNTGGGNFFFGAEVNDSTGVNLEAYPTAYYGAPPTAGQWTKIAGTIIVDNGYDLMWPVLQLQDDIPVGNIFYFDDVRLVDISEMASGSLTLTNKTLTDPRVSNILDTNGNYAVEFWATASAANRIAIQNKPVGSSPGIFAAGSDSNLDLVFGPKGTGGITFYVGTTGNPVRIYAGGPDADHNINLVPKGAGVVQANGVAVARKYTATIGNGVLTSIAVTHNLGTQDVTWSIRDATTNEFVDCDVISTSTTQTTFVFALAPATNAYKVVIIG